MNHGHGGHTAAAAATFASPRNADYTRNYMRVARARQAASSNGGQGRTDALAVLASVDEVAARVLISGWKVGRLRDALIVLAAAIPEDLPVSRIGRAA